MTESATRISVEIGERLRAYREHSRLSQDRLAELVGGTKRGIQDNEAGRTAPNSKLLTGLAQNGLSINWLLTGKGPMLVADLDTSTTSVNGEILGMALAAVEKIAAERRLKLPPETRGKLGALVYQYFLIEKAETEATAYVAQLMELVSNH
ncbi:helix-turn-helix domain-containing protein [Burkholderia sp. BDU5]|uniref:helix-turn-helix domain-containing protein n=1 Tax=Burkholderia sp. BDU5 TaxID=1385590 RepID=UPI0009E92FE6|nr:helix-turn-helix transcriptional regulator [Burkholderia sp. BDU5]